MYNKIAAFCDEQKISIAQLCRNLGISPAIISNLKTHSATRPSAGLSAENAAKIADFMGISVTELIKKED